MKTRFNRLLALVLSAAMALQLGGISVFAAGEIVVQTITAPTETTVSVVYNTSEADVIATLPETLDGTNGSDEAITIEVVTWESSTYIGQIPGDYEFAPVLSDTYDIETHSVTLPTITITVQDPVDTSLILVANPTSITVGDSVTFTATVSGGTPAGTVSFYVGESVSGTLIEADVTLDDSGVATSAAYSALGVGANQSIYAEYIPALGSEFFGSSGTTTVTVNAVGATLSMTMDAAANTITYGEEIILTATLTETDGDEAIQALGISFHLDSAGGTQIGAGDTNTEGQVSLTLTEANRDILTAGSHTIYVVFPGSPFYGATDTSVTVTVEQKPVTVSPGSFVAANRQYDATDVVAITNGPLFPQGAIDDDDVAVDPVATGTIPDKSAGDGRPVTINATLSGDDAGNYTMTQPDDITVNILPKEITASGIQVTSKVYNGDMDNAEVVFTFADGAVEEGDALSATATGSTFASPYVGTDIPVTVGSTLKGGDDSGNYNVDFNLDVLTLNLTGEITLCPVEVTISGDDNPTYDGSPKALEATYTPVGYDSPNAVVLYDGSEDAPTLAGTYVLTTQINDTNYSLDNTTGPSSLTIALGTLIVAGPNIIVTEGDTAEKTAQVTIEAPEGSAEPTGIYSIGTVTGNAILNGAPTIDTATGQVTFSLLDTATNGQSATILVTYTPEAGTYNVANANIIVSVGEDAGTTTVVGMPITVNLGEDIDLTGVTLDTDYEFLEDVSTPVTIGMLSGYNKNATGSGSIGEKKITVTDGARIDFQDITVNDVVIDITGVVPTKRDYEWNEDTVLDLTGGEVLKIMQSAIPQVAEPMTAAMLSVTNNDLKTLGEHHVTVTYAGITAEDMFTITVESTTELGGDSHNVPGVNVGEATFTNESGDSVDIADITMTVEPVAVTEELEGLIDEASQFNGIPEGNLLMVDISLDAAGSAVQPSGAVRVYLPLPAGASRRDTFRILHQREDLTAGYEILAAHTTAIGIWFDVTHFSSFAVGWKSTPAATSGSSSSNWYDDNDDFWQTVKEQILGARSGITIRVDAGDYDRMSTSVMAALRNSGVTLVIRWDDGDKITIPAGKAQPENLYRLYYPLSLLEDLYSGSAARIPETGGGVIEIKAPTATAPNPQEITPKDEGIIIEEPEAVTQPEDSEVTAVPAAAQTVAEAPEKNAPNPILWAIILMGIVALAGGGLWFAKRRGVF
ncbi:MAG: YDG domain-containing protein [Acetanaerobacterium sp.]